MRVIEAIFKVFIVAVILAACAPTGCPGVKKFSKEDQKQIAKERNGLSDNDPLKSFIDEGERLRRACR